MNIDLKKDGFVAKILTWGMTPQKKRRYLNGLQNGCPMFWRFVFMYIWTLGGRRNDHINEPLVSDVAPKKRNETMVRINAAVSDFSETKTAQRIGKGIGISFGAAFAVGVTWLVAWLCIGIYRFFSGGWDNILGLGTVLGILALIGITIFILWKGASRLVRWIGGTEAWALFVQKVKSLKEKTCPVVSFA